MGIIFLAWLCIAAVLDAVERRCPNWLIVSGFLVGIFVIFIGSGLNFYYVSISSRLIGLFSAFFILIVFYKLGMMGGGDVKFASVLGLWVGWEVLIVVWGLSCLMAIIHGLFARSHIKNFFSFSALMEDGRGRAGERFIPYITYLSLSTVIVMGIYK